MADVTPKRLRVIDVGTPWFWFVVFWHGPRYGEPTAEALLYPSRRFGRQFTFLVWRREDVPDTRAGVALGEEEK